MLYKLLFRSLRGSEGRGALKRSLRSCFRPIGCVSTIPANVVLASLLDQADSFKHIGDVVDSALLDLEGVDGLVKVKGLLRRPLQ